MHNVIDCPTPRHQHPRFDRRASRHAPVAARHAIGACVLLAVALAAWPSHARAGGGPENVALIVDPTQPESLYLGNYYRVARGIPERNVLYMSPGAADYRAFAAYNLDALFGTLANRGLDDHIDYVVVAPGSTYYVSAQGLVTDNACPAPITRLAISSAYGLAFSEQEILGGGLMYNDRNRYYGPNDEAIAFDSRTTWYNGAPSTDERARRHFIGFLLGYTGKGGNSVDELVQMIDNSVEADGSRPDGTFYLMRTDDRLRSGPRDGTFARVAASIQSLGGKAEVLDGVLPAGKDDVMGVITGYAAFDIANTPMTFLPGAYADHLTSYAGDFDDTGQTKMTRWIGKGASGSAGAVEEPCNGAGKFPNARILVWYLQGLSLGESLFRSNAWTPFQTLYYGDPLTRPFARFPSVTMFDVPSGEASGAIALTPWALPGTSGATIGKIDLYVDGALYQTVAPGQVFVVDPFRIGDGLHLLDAVATEAAAIATQGRWHGSLRVNALGRKTTLAASATEGTMSTLFVLEASAVGGTATEIRLQQGTRVIAAGPGGAATFRVPARLIGAGPVDLTAVAEFDDGRLAISDPVRLDIEYDGSGPPPSPGPARPAAYSYAADVLPGASVLFDLPASDDDGDLLTRTVDQGPSQSTIESGGSSFLLRAPAQAVGVDQLSFHASDGNQVSDVATVRIRYCTPPQITLPPADVEVCPGETARLEVAAAGGTLAYQWFRNDQPIAGANRSVYTVRSAKGADAGSYRVEVTRTCGQVWNSATSDPATVSISSDSRCRVRIALPYAANNAARP